MKALTSHLSRNGFEDSTMDIVKKLQGAKLHSETGRQTFSKKIPGASVNLDHWIIYVLLSR